MTQAGDNSPFRSSGEARRHPRFHTTILKSPLGDIVNLSGGGACIRCKGRPAAAPGQILQLTIQSPTQKIRVTAKVLRVIRRGFWRFEVGLTFVDLKPGLASALQQFAQFGFIPFGENDAGGPTNPPSEPTPAAQHTGSRRPTLRAFLEIPDPYEQLGIAPSADAEEIKSAYRRIARTCHPDVNNDPAAAARFIACTQAYELLVDPERRREYDEDQAARHAA